MTYFIKLLQHHDSSCTFDIICSASAINKEAKYDNLSLMSYMSREETVGLPPDVFRLGKRYLFACVAILA